MTFGQIIMWTLLGLLALVLSVFIYGGTKNRITRNKQKRIFSDTFSDRNFSLPTIVFGYQYSWPIFKITFDSSTAFQNAQRQGLLTKFEKEIGSFYGPEFDPTIAITYLYPDKNLN
jgi:hypothetical protein